MTPPTNLVYISLEIDDILQSLSLDVNRKHSILESAQDGMG